MCSLPLFSYCNIEDILYEQWHEGQTNHINYPFKIPSLFETKFKITFTIILSIFPFILLYNNILKHFYIYNNNTLLNMYIITLL